ncbi:MAG: SOS response-associated peptidase [Pseudomonadota bacterium]
MCGRFSLTAEPEELQELFGVLEFGHFPARYNIAPTQPILTVGIGALGDRQGMLVRWGLIPHWVKDPNDFTLLINARSETASTKASFKTAMRHRRVLIPASGFYEWHRPADKKQPKQAYWISPRDQKTICFAGLVETWMGKDGTEIDTGCILTTQSNDQIGNIHHRMPVVIKPEDFDRWLDCKTQEPRDVANLMQPIEDGFFEAIAVSDRVNKVANTGPEVQVPGTAEPAVAKPKQTKEKPDTGQMDLF